MIIPWIALGSIYATIVKGIVGVCWKDESKVVIHSSWLCLMKLWMLKKEE